MAALNKANASQKIDPANKERALKYMDEAIAVDGGANAAALKAMRERITTGASTSPATKPAAEVKKTDKGA
jgi:hypothetical protein